MNENDGMTGGCLCGAVRFAADGVETGHHACHCAMCRRWGSGPFLAATVAAIRFKSEDDIVVYPSSDWAERGFCAKCGTNLFYRLKDAGTHFISVGTFDDAAAFTVIGEIYIDAKPPGYAMAGNHPRLTEKQVLEKFGIS